MTRTEMKARAKALEVRALEILDILEQGGDVDSAVLDASVNEAYALMGIAADILKGVKEPEGESDV